MREKELKFTLKIFDNEKELPAHGFNLLLAAREALKDAYAPYSKYRVGAAVLLQNGKIIKGANQENAAFPAGICAEGTALTAASSLYPNIAVQKIAITVKSETHTVNHPVAPCGICRQRIAEYENRFENEIEIIFSGEEGYIYMVSTVKDILPFSFSKSDL